MPSPICDIIVLVHDQPAWTDLVIRAVEYHTRNPYRLIIVDMASQEDATARVLADAGERGHTVIHCADNRSFSSGCNVGVMTGTSPFVILLNNDALPTPGWDTALLQDASEKTVGLVGARSNYAAGPQGDPGFQGEPPFLVFVCVAMRRDVWDAVGPLDGITFDGFSSEDLDYSWRVRKMGFKLKVSSAFVLHAGSQTLAAVAGDAAAHQRNNEKYNARLIDKWGKAWVTENTKLKKSILVTSYSPNRWSDGDFFASLLSLKQAPGVGFSFHPMRRVPIHLARQMIADYALDQGFDYLVQLDDDATFPPDLLRRFLAHDKDVVCALAYQRKPPYMSCAFEFAGDGLSGVHMEGIEHSGLRRVDISGFHCSMIKTSVFKKLRDGGVKAFYGGFDKVGEDFAMCQNLKKIGVPVYCDTDLISGHIGDPIVVDEGYKAAHKAGRAP
jgi:GT2 family glycosyltransferase